MSDISDSAEQGFDEQARVSSHVREQELEGTTSAPRYLALVIDNIFAIVCGVVVGSLLNNVSQALAATLGILSYFAYFFIQEWRWARTLGKKFCGLIILKTDGSWPGWQEAAVRTLLRLIEVNPGFGGLIGGLAILMSRRHQRIGDMLADTVVVRLEDVDFPVESI